MTEEKIQELLQSLFKLKYNWKTSGDSYTSDVVNKEGRLIVEEIVRKFLNENHDEKLGVLEAKVFMYEQIIAKSTFAPMIYPEPNIKHIPDEEIRLTPQWKEKP